MKIFILNKYDAKHPRAGGAEARLREMCLLLNKKGHEVYLLSAMYPRAKRREFVSGTNIFRIGFKNSYNVVFIHILGFLYAPFFIRKIRPDIIYEDISPLPWFTPLTMPHKKKVIIIHHINAGFFFKTQFLPLAIIAYVVEQSIRLFYKRERIITVSPSTTKELLKMGFNKKNLYEFRDGVDFDKYHPGKSKFKEPTVLFLGRLDKRKGLDLLIKTYDYVVRKIPNVRYIIIGDGKDGREFKDLARGKSRIEFKGFVSGNEKLNYLKKSWILAVPSRTEGYCMAVLEAGACKLPVIANNVSGLRDSVIHNKTGLLVNCYNTKEFADAIVYLLTNKKLRVRFGENARIWALKHDWNKVVDKTLKLMKQVINN
ncbi:MAG: glycosyltransferase [Nitrospiraceae bacterium]|nr:glycosyltransferase [Nitrospiraceae bacterium]